MKRTERQQQGFTAIELIIVMTLLLLFAVAVNFTYPGKSIDLYAESQRLAGDIQFAQSLAMAKGQRIRINFLSAQSYGFSNLANTIVIAPPAEANQTSVLLSEGITLSAPTSFLVFDTLGQPYNVISGSALSSQYVITLSADGESKQVIVYPQTGAVVVQ